MSLENTRSKQASCSNETGFGRRSFIKKMTALLGGITFMNCRLFSTRSLGNTADNQEKLVFIAIDALNPKYFELDAKGFPGGSEGNWLMPNIHAFLKRSMWFRNAECYFPAATDMNHLNALAGHAPARPGSSAYGRSLLRSDKSGEAVLDQTYQHVICKGR